MAYEQVLDLGTDSTVSVGGLNKKTGKSNPKHIEGYYIGSKHGIKTKFGDASLHIFQTPDGNVGVWGKRHSNQLLAGAIPGRMSKLEFTHMAPTKNNDEYRYKFFQDKTNTIEVPNADEIVTSDDTDTTAFANDDSNDDSDSSDLMDEDETPSPPTPPQRAASPATATRQAQIQAMLSGRTKKSA